MTRIVLALTLSALTLGCRTKEEVPVDFDLDGYDETEDCDDTNAAVYPGADELCDGLDNDCDAELDEEAVDMLTFYVDADGDGFGGAESLDACEQPSGHVEDSTDCDDALDTVFPGADEYCNELDDDCDGEVDEDPVDSATWYYDGDADGYGDPATWTVDCEAPSSYVDNPDDCDDTSADFYPGAPEEDCTDPNDYNCDGSVGWADEDRDGWAACEECDDTDRAVNPAATEVCDGIDNDCNGTVDTIEAVDALTWYADSDSDGYGDASTTTKDCDQPAGYVADATDCDDSSDATYPGADEYCDDADNDCDSTVDEDSLDAPTWYMDADSDGYGGSSSTEECDQPSGHVSDSTDCDDLSATSYPGADEICDDEDNDCDGSIDEEAIDAPTWYEDADGDGHGDATSTTETCDEPSGYTDDATDCDDDDATSFPGGTEVCDGADNDCDGSTDEDDAVDVLTWYADTDGDGYGDASVTDIDCDQPSGYVSDDSDCDDTASSVYPGATEYCDEVDNDCDGTVDEDAAIDASTWYLDADEDGYGSASRTDTACDQPSGYVSDATDCDDLDDSAYPGATEYCDEVDNDCDGTTDEGAVDQTTWYADSDGDGYGDLWTNTDACDQPSGYIEDATDCDDTDAATYPGAVEYCDDHDEDCDGVNDNDAVDGDVWFLDADGDGYGDASSYQQACDQPSGYVADSSDCEDGSADAYPGGTEVCDTYDNDCDGGIDEDWEVLGGGVDCPADSCDDILTSLSSTPSTGAFYIDPLGSGSPYQVYCDMSTDGGGWTLVFTSPANLSTYGSGFNGWWSTGNTTVIDSLSDTGKSQAYDEVSVSEIMLTATQPNTSVHITSLGTTFSATVSMPGSEPTSCSGLQGVPRRYYTGSSVSGSYFPNSYLGIVACDTDSTDLESSGGNYDMAVFTTNLSHGDYNYANGDIGSEFRVGGQSGTTAASSSNRLSVWVR